ncbi:MAG TPA: transketolase [Leptospiraceae bacterium]|nr:transketolase [Leptospiraceae bacterium]
MNVNELKTKAQEIRREIIKMVGNAKSGHPGGPLGLADIYSALYFKVLNHDPKNPEKEDRDRLILSNGHVCAVRYAAMALSGYFAVQELSTFRALGSRLQGHPSTRYLPGVESSSGSLGQGLSVATGIALGAKMQKKNYKVYTCISDGECGEGMTWEAAQSAVHFKLNNLIAFMDRNFIQIDGFTEDIMRLEPLGKKFEMFGWNLIEADGHDMNAILDAFEQAKAKTEGPTLIVFRTVLGKGVSFMENKPEWHGTPPNAEQMEKALQEIGV